MNLESQVTLLPILPIYRSSETKLAWGEGTFTVSETCSSSMWHCITRRLVPDVLRPLNSLKTPIANHSMMQHHIPGKQRPQLHQYNCIKTCNFTFYQCPTASTYMQLVCQFYSSWRLSAIIIKSVPSTYIYFRMVNVLNRKFWHCEVEF